MEKRKKQPSLTTKLMLMMFGISAIITVIISLYLKYSVTDDIEADILKNASQQAKAVGVESVEAIESLNNQLANKVIGRYSRVSSVRQAAILLSDSSLLGYYSKSNPTPLNPVLAMNTSKTLQRVYENVKIVEPVYKGDSKIGYVFVLYDSKKLFNLQTDFFWFITGLASLMFATSFFFARYFKKLFASPIHAIVKDLIEMQDSKALTIRLNELNDNDVGGLVASFNKVLDIAQQREIDSETRAQRMEKLVDVRTKQLVKKVHYDSLTGLPNRYLFVDRLRQAITHSERVQSKVILLFLDLDRFKVVNDSFGHQNGDLLLKEVAGRLKKIARKTDTVARLGGDEFVFLLEDQFDTQSAERSAARIIECFNEPFNLQQHLLHISTSIGISVYPEDGHNDKILLKNADISMYHAKKKGPGNFTYYSKEMDSTSFKKLAIETNLRSAIKNNELTLVYQPQMQLNEKCYRSVEALLRWKNSELGDISPAVFIPICEETGLIKKIDLWVISRVCQQIKVWNEQGLSDITVAINISAGHLIGDDLLEHLKSEILIHQIKAKQIEIEITEEVFVEQTERTIENLKAIKKMGSRIAIDDFGTGYSSLQYIQDFPADTLKLDGMFIKNLQTDKTSQGIVRSTIILAHSLGLNLVAECVENQWQFDFLEKNDCDLIQGFYLSKPLLADQIPAICDTIFGPEKIS